MWRASRPNAVRHACTVARLLVTSNTAPMPIVRCARRLCSGSSSHTSSSTGSSHEEDDGSLLPTQPGTRIYANRAVPNVRTEALLQGVPLTPPFGLMVIDTAGLDRDVLLSVFEMVRCTDVVMVAAKNAHVFFETRDDLIAALEVSGSADIRHLTLIPSPRLKNLARMGDKPPFRAQLSQLPAGVTRRHLVHLFQKMNPDLCFLMESGPDGLKQPVAFMTFRKKADLLKAMNSSGSSSVDGILVNPAYTGSEPPS